MSNAGNQQRYFAELRKVTLEFFQTMPGKTKLEQDDLVRQVKEMLDEAGL